LGGKYGVGLLSDAFSMLRAEASDALFPASEAANLRPRQADPALLPSRLEHAPVVAKAPLYSVLVRSLNWLLVSNSPHVQKERLSARRLMRALNPRRSGW
jgi:hypothetical protein